METMVPSVQVQLAFKSKNGEEFTIRVRNLSKRAVTSFSVGIPEYTANPCCMGQERSRAHPSIPVENYSEVGVFKFALGKVVIVAALFSDGSFEGDQEKAAELAGRQVGREIQTERITEQITKVLENRELDESGKVARIQSDLQETPVTPDPAMLERLHKEFPTLLINEDTAMAQLKTGLEMQRGNVLSDLKQYEIRAPGYSQLKTIAEWWKYVSDAL